jgi:hypothetical protein
MENILEDISEDMQSANLKELVAGLDETFISRFRDLEQVEKAALFRGIIDGQIKMKAARLYLCGVENEQSNS